jgi:hypothetical protein
MLICSCEKQGLDGLNSLVKIDIEPNGENCASGGYKISSGLDLNNDNVLNNDEIQSTNFLCHGISGIDGKDGENGINGYNSLILVLPETNSIYCPQGGYLIQSGIDINRNDTLDGNEVQSTSYLCHGNNNNLDKRIIIPFIGRNGIQGSSTLGTVVSEQVIHGFNINDYPEADSVVFGGFQWSLESGVECSVELYDLTNNKVIEDTQIKANATASTTKWTATTKNFINHLPQETIDLGVFIKSSQEGERVYITALALIVYRN